MTCRAFGIPVWGVQQPGHAAIGYLGSDGWRTAYGGGWHRSRWGSQKGPAFLAEAEARSHVTEFSLAEHLRWLAAALTSKGKADAVINVAREIQERASTPKPALAPELEEEAEAEARTRVVPIAALTLPSKPEKPFEAIPGVLHVEAESFSKMSGICVHDCFTGGKQVYFQKNLKLSWIDYALDVPETGAYGVTMRAATPNYRQIIDISSGTTKLATAKVPNTHGLWGTTPEVDIQLRKGPQTLRLSTPYQRGIALRWLELKRKE